MFSNNSQCASFPADSDAQDNIYATETLNSDDKIDGLSLHYVFGETKCKYDETKSYSLQVNIKCNQDAKAFSPATATSKDKCNIVRTYESDKGCPVFELSIFNQFVSKYYWLFGIILILSGLVVAFFGSKFVNVMIYTTVTLGIFMVAGYFVFNLLAEIAFFKKTWVQITFFALFFLLSNVIGYFTMRIRRVAVALTAAFGGYMLALTLLAAFMAFMKEKIWQQYLLKISIPVVFGLCTLLMEETIVMFITSFIGSYLLIRGISFYAGGFPVETQFAEMLNKNVINWHSFQKGFYGYLAGIVTLTILSLYF